MLQESDCKYWLEGTLSNVVVVLIYIIGQLSEKFVDHSVGSQEHKMCNKSSMICDDYAYSRHAAPWQILISQVLRMSTCRVSAAFYIWGQCWLFTTDTSRICSLEKHGYVIFNYARK